MNKLIHMPAAVGLIADSGCRLALGGVTLYRRPMAFSLAVLAQSLSLGSPRQLELLCFTAGLESDLLVGADLVARVRTCYFGLESFGLAPQFTRAANQGQIEIMEESEASLANGLRATLAGIGFMPSLAWQGTELYALRPDVKTIIDPYTGEELTAFPAIGCDLAVIHALEADAQGNAIIGGNQGVDVELALVAETVVVTAEKVVDELSRADLVAPVVDFVVEAPSGAWPTSCHPAYPLDGLQVLNYVESVGREDHHALLASWAEKHRIAWPAR